MANAPNIGDVGASVQKSTVIQGQQPGSSSVQRANFNYAPKFVNWKGVKTPAGVSQQPSYGLNFNQSYASFNKQYLTPNYTPSEFLALGAKGYVGAFTDKNKTLLSLMGPAYSTQRALWSLQSGHKITPYTDFTPVNEFGTHGINIYGGVLDAAQVPTAGDVAQYATSAIKFTTKYGSDGAGYLKRYGHLPSATSSYGNLFGANSQGIVQNAVDKFQKSNYSSIVAGYTRQLAITTGMLADNTLKVAQNIAQSNPTVASTLVQKANVLKLASVAHNPDNKKTGKSNLNDIAELQRALGIRVADKKTGVLGDVLPGGGASNKLDTWNINNVGSIWNPTVVNIVNSVIPSQIAAANNGLAPDSPIWANTSLSAFASGLINTASSASTEKGVPVPVNTQKASSALSSYDKMIAGTPTQNNSNSGTDILAQSAPDSIMAVALNTVKGIASRASGVTMGGALALDYAGNSINNIMSGNFSGKHNVLGIDTTMVDTLGANYIARYITPFDTGITNAASWKKFATIAGQDPIAPVLDALAVVPVVGAIAKAGDLALLARATKFGPLKASANLASAADKSIIAENAFNPATTKAGIAKVSAAQARVDAAVVPKLNVSLNLFRRNLVDAHNGSQTARNNIDNWRLQGLVIPSYGKNASWHLKAAAAFEARAKEVAPPPRALNYTEGQPTAAIRVMPGSPLVRGTQNLFMVTTRGISAIADKIPVGESTPFKKVTNVLVGFAHSPYDWQYLRAQKSSLQNFAGDITSQVDVAKHMTSLYKSFDPPLNTTEQRVMLAFLADGGVGRSGFGSIADPAYARTIMNRNIDLAKKEAIATNNPNMFREDVFTAAKNQIPNQTAYEQIGARFAQKVADPAGVVLSAREEAMYSVFKQQKSMQTKIMRLVHSETPINVKEHLLNAYGEVFGALKLRPQDLFGTNPKLTGKAATDYVPTEGVWHSNGELSPYKDRVLSVNSNFPWHEALHGYHEPHNLLIDKNGNSVFNNIKDAAVRKNAIKNFNEFFNALTTKNAGPKPGILRDGLGSPEAPGGPVLILAKGANISSDYVKVHIAKYTGGISDKGVAYRSDIVSPNEVYIIPKELLHSKLDSAQAWTTLQDGVLNAQSSYHPNPTFYSDKINTAGLLGVASNFKDHANEHIVATSGLRMHSLETHLASQIFYAKNNVGLELAPILENNAELHPVSATNGPKKGYRGLDHVKVFDNIETAKQFAQAKGVGPQFDAAVKDSYINPDNYKITNPAGITNSYGTIIYKGQTLHVVKGDLTDQAVTAVLRASATGTEIGMIPTDVFPHPDNFSAQGGAHMQFVVPKKVDNLVNDIAGNGNDFAKRYMSDGALGKVAQGTGFWKDLALWGPHFISTNTLGATSLAIMHNPLMAGKLMIGLLAYGALKAGRKDLYNIQGESRVLTHSMAYENQNNVYNPNTMFASAEKTSFASKANKYGWKGGYALVAGFEHVMRNLVAKNFLESNAAFKAFMSGPEVAQYIKNGVDMFGASRTDITPFEAAADLLLNPGTKHFDPLLKTRMRYTVNSVAGNYHQFNNGEKLMRNTLVPFYAWQRHALAYTWRLAVDKPLLADVYANMGQYGYNQVLQSNLPSWMDQTIPLPSFLENNKIISGIDHRIDLNNVLAFSTTADLAIATTQALVGTGQGKLGPNMFSLMHPIVGNTVKAVLHVDPLTGHAIKPADQSGMLQLMYDTLNATPAFKLPKTIAWDAINGQYSDNALANKYKSISASDVFKNYDSNNPDAFKPVLPKESATIAPTSWLDSVSGALFPVKLYHSNMERLHEQHAQEMVAAGVLKASQDQYMQKSLTNYISHVKTWKQNRDLITKVLIPSGTYTQQQQQLLLTWLEKSKGKGLAGVSFDTILRSIGG